MQAGIDMPCHHAVSLPIDLTLIHVIWAFVYRGVDVAVGGVFLFNLQFHFYTRAILTWYWYVPVPCIIPFPVLCFDFLGRGRLRMVLFLLPGEHMFAVLLSTVIYLKLGLCIIPGTGMLRVTVLHSYKDYES